MFIADNIRYLRKKAGYSQEDLSNLLGYKSFTTIQKWESGVSSPPLEICARMADIFSVDLDLFVRTDLSKQESVIMKTDGSGLEADPSQETDFILFRVSDSSMDPKYQIDDIVLFEPQNDFSNGDECLISMNGSDPLLRKIRISGHYLMLQPINPEFEPVSILLGEDSDSDVRILGVAKEIRRSV